MDIGYEVWEVRKDGKWSRYKAEGDQDNNVGSVDSASVVPIPTEQTDSNSGHDPAENAAISEDKDELSVVDDINSDPIFKVSVTVPGPIILDSHSCTDSSSSTSPLVVGPGALPVTDLPAQDGKCCERPADNDGRISNDSSEDEEIDIDDPAIYSNRRVDESTISLLLNRPCQPADDFVYPCTNGRRYSKAWFWRTLPDGSRQQRKWLSYSKSSDKLFCIYCMLFGGPVTADSKVWVQQGFNTWSNISRDLPNHETSGVHNCAETNRMAWLFGASTRSQMTSQRQDLVDTNRRAVSTEIKAIQWLATEMVALRGHDSFDGKFLSLYSLLAQFDPSAKAYLDRLDSIRAKDIRGKPAINVLSPRNVRRLLKVMENKIVERIVARMKVSGVCSIINDGTQDLSKMEASCLLIRYVEADGTGRPRPVERVIGIFTTGSTSGQALCEKILQHLDAVDLPLTHVIGQSYDGAGNMSGKYQGLQARIREVQPKALYIWCSAHRLNLVIEDVLSCSVAVNNAMGILQELYNFFGTHRRHEVLMSMQTEERYKRTLKRVSKTTRTWRSSEDGCTTFLDTFDTIVAALEKLRLKHNDAATVATATGLLLRMKEFDVIAAVHILYLIFRTTGPASRILQSVAADLAITSQVIKSCMTQLQEIRTKDSSWADLLNKIKSFAEKHGLSSLTRVFSQKRVTRTPRRPGELAEDERCPDKVEAFKRDVFFKCFDTVIVQMSSRFTDGTITVVQQMSHFTHGSLMDEQKAAVTPQDIAELCAMYGLEKEEVVQEFLEFQNAYRNVHHMISVDDLTSGNSRSYDGRSSHGSGSPTPRTRSTALVKVDDKHGSEDEADDDERKGIVYLTLL